MESPHTPMSSAQRGLHNANAGASSDSAARRRALERRHRRAGWLLTVMGLLAFVAVFLWMTTGGSGGADQAVHDWFVTHRVAALNGFMVGVSTVFGVLVESVMIGAVALWFWIVRQRAAAVILIGAMIVTVVVSEFVKVFVQRPRPDPAFWLGAPENSFSFPSGHTVSTGVFLLVTGYLWWRMRPSRTRVIVGIVVASSVTALVVTSRLYLGVHWMTDTLASACLAVAILGMTVLVTQGLQGVGYPDAMPAQETRIARGSVPVGAAGAGDDPE